MLQYSLRRLLYMVLTLLVVSVVTFIVIQLPPGDYLTHKMAEAIAVGNVASVEQIEQERRLYGLDRPLVEQYVHWMGFHWFLPFLSSTVHDEAQQAYQEDLSRWEGLPEPIRKTQPRPEDPGMGFFRPANRGLLQGNLGRSFAQDKPVTELLAERLPLTMLLFVCSVVLVYSIAIPVGVYSATNQYTLGDYMGMGASFIGMSIPGFLLALVMMFAMFNWYGLSPGGMFSPEYLDAEWSWGRGIDFLKHLAGPLLVVGINGTAGLIRVMRANLLDQLRQLYVTTARAKGVAEWKLLLKNPTRVAFIPVVSSLGFLLPGLIGGQAIISKVLGLPTFGPLLIEALQSQDMYRAGSVVMIQTTLVVVGTFLSDMLLGVVDPRIRLTGGTK